MKKNILKRLFALVLAMVMALGLTGCASPEGQYNAANKLLIKGEYEKAAEKFEALGSFNDAPQMTRYCRAMAAGENGQYESAVKTFESMGDFKDCPSLVTYYTARYYEAEGGKEPDHVKWYNAEGWVYYEKAFALYDTLPMFRDSDTRAEACLKAVYDRGITLADGGNYAAASYVMEILGEYPDAENKAEYYAACACEADGEYSEAYELFIDLGQYADAPARAAAVLDMAYEAGEAVYADGEYGDAYEYFHWLAENTDYTHANGNPADRAKECAYSEGEKLLTADKPDYDGARTAFEIAGEYAPEGKPTATEQMKECWYLEGIETGKNGDYARAMVLLHKMPDYKDVNEQIAALRAGFPGSVTAGGDHTVGLKSDGTVVAVGKNGDGQCNVSDWTDIVQVSAGECHTVGLKADGTVVAVGDNDDGQCNVSDWTDIVQVSAGDYHTVGLKSDGTVVAVGDNYFGQCDVSDWKDIVQVSAGGKFTVGLKSDGTVVAVGRNLYCQCYVSDWMDIVQVSAGGYHTVGLKSDGTVVAVGNKDNAQCNVSGWTDIVQISAGGYHTVGLRSNGTVVTTTVLNETYYQVDYGQCDVSDWTDIVQVSAGYYHTVGLKSDGTVVAVGYNKFGRCNVSGWHLKEN